MLKFTKNRIIILGVVIIVILGGIVGWAFYQKSKLPLRKEVAPPEIVIGKPFTFSAIVSKIDTENNFLIVKPISNKEKEIKVILREYTKLTKLEFPFDIKNPPKETQFTFKEYEITIKDFKERDTVHIKTYEDFTEKTEIDNVEFVQIMP